LLTVPREGAKECEFVMFNPMSSNEAFIKVALYARVSSEDQVERETIQNQVHIANTLCPAMGLEIVASYLDDGVSGTISLEKRPQGGLLLEDAKKGKFSQVVVYRLDRIGRTGLVILSAWESFKQRGIAFKSLTEPFDTSQPFGEFVMGILAMVAGYERDSIVTRTTEGRRRKAREGYWTGGRAPLGYKVVDGRLEVDDEEAGLIRRIFTQYTEDRLSGWKIAIQLNAEEVPTQATRRGFTTKKIKQQNHWDYTRVLSILKNKTYAGVRLVGKRGKGTVIEQPVPAIVPRDTWELAQKIAKSNWSNAPRNAKRDYLLRGLVFCGVCGRRYIGVTTNVAYYKCGRQGCTNKAIPCDLAEQTVWEDILGFVHNPGPVIEELREQMANTDSTSIQTECQEIGVAIARLGEERQRILYCIRKGLVSDEEGDTQLIATGQERDMLEARKASLEAQLQGQEGQRVQLSAAEALLKELRDKSESANNHTKRRVMETLVVSAVVNGGDSGEIQFEPKYRFEDPDKLVTSRQHQE
jgi:site-specific DNA recombinase